MKQNTASPTLPHLQRDMSAYDALEIHPIKEYSIAADGHCTGDTFSEPCEPHEADFWSVFGHLKTGGLECIKDFANNKEAEIFAESLRQDYSNL